MKKPHLFFELSLALWTSQMQCRNFWEHGHQQHTSPQIQPCGKMLHRKQFSCLPGYYLPKLAEPWARMRSAVGHRTNASLTQLSAAQEMWSCLRGHPLYFFSSGAGLSWTWIDFLAAGDEATSNVTFETYRSLT